MSRPIVRRGGRKRRESGAALVEFAFVLPVLLLIIFGIIDFSRAYNAKQELTHATREGARVYAVTSNHTAAAAAFWSGAVGLDATKVAVTIPADNLCPPGSPVQVSATYAFDFVALPFVSFQIGSEAVMRCGG